MNTFPIPREIIAGFVYNQFTVTINNFVNIMETNIRLDLPIIESLLKEYKSLMLSSNTSNLFTDIPEYITRLCLNLEDYSKININHLHLNLKELYILAESNNDFNSTIDNLPIGLEILLIQSQDFNQSLDNLPITLKKLIINSDSFTNSLSNLPPNLEYLELTKYSRYNIENHIFSDNFLNLPHNLTNIKIGLMYLQKCNIDLFNKKYPNLQKNF
jgi:hypothetical protein